MIIAVGQMFVMLTAGIDLSVTSTVAVTSVVGGYVMSSDTGLFQNPGLAIFCGIISMILSGSILGLINGVAVSKLRMPAFMVTLTSMLFFNGFAVWMTKSQSIYNLPEAFVNFPYTYWLGIPTPIFIGLCIILVAYYLLTKSIYGEWIYAVGTNPKAALISGVNIHQTRIWVYIISGVCASIGSILYTARLETGSPVMGQNILLDVIGAVVIGGTSLFGGKGKLQGILAGALLMTLLDNSLNLLGLSFFLIMMGKGGIILITSMFNVMNEKRAMNHA